VLTSGRIAAAADGSGGGGAAAAVSAEVALAVFMLAGLPLLTRGQFGKQVWHLLVTYTSSEGPRIPQKPFQD
jgi:hypothetical protein